MRLLLALALLASGGIERAAENGAQASLTPNGRLLVYIQNDPKGVADVFVLDRRSGRRERVSVGSRGQRGKGASIEPSISDDGRFVAFISDAKNLVRGDRDEHANVFLHDRATRRTIRLPGTELDAAGARPVFSRDGRWLAYSSVTGGLVVREGRTGCSTRIGLGGGPSISAEAATSHTRGVPHARVRARPRHRAHDRSGRGRHRSSRGHALE